MSDLIAIAKLEEAQLIAELEKSVTFRRLELVRQFIAAYVSVDENTTLKADATRVDRENRKTDSKEKSVNRLNPTTQSKIFADREPVKGSSYSSQVVAETYIFLDKIERRAQSLEIVAVLRGKGFTLPVVRPSAAISSILSHSEFFDNKRGEGQGYGLKKWLSDPIKSIFTSDADGVGPGRPTIEGGSDVDSGGTQTANPLHTERGTPKSEAPR